MKLVDWIEAELAKVLFPDRPAVRQTIAIYLARRLIAAGIVEEDDAQHVETKQPWVR